MVRNLPWLQKTPERSQNSTARTGSSPKRRRLNNGASKYEVRTPSTSPPPQAPTDTPMKPSDASWVMVEDEFYTTAQSFTQHLHHAEYKRLKLLAEKRMRDPLQAIARPVTGGQISKETQTKLNASKRKSRLEGSVKAVVERNANSDDETAGSHSSEEEINIGDKNLACLMQGTGSAIVQKRSLVGLAGLAQSNTRAAAGFHKQSHSSPSKSRGFQTSQQKPPARSDNFPALSDEETDEDLEEGFDVPIDPAPERPLNHPAPRNLSTPFQHSNPQLPETLPKPSGDRKAQQDDRQNNPRTTRAPLETEWLPLSRRAARKDKSRRNDEQKAVQLNEIPTFLF